MTIYKVNNLGKKPTYYVASKEALDQAIAINPDLDYVIGGLVDAQAALDVIKTAQLEAEKVRFSICATFVNGNDTTWREIQDSDPEDTICQVFDTFTGTYTQVNSKTEANQLNEQKKQAYLDSVGLGSLVELSEVPAPLPQPKSSGTQTL